MNTTRLKQSYMVNTEVFSKNIGGKIYLMMSKTDYVCELNTTAAFLWKCLRKSVSIEDLVKEMSLVFQVSPEVARRDIQVFIDEYLLRGFVKKVSQVK